MSTPASADDRRLAELDRLDALSACGARGADLLAIVAATARLLDVPKVAINLITADEQHQVAAYGFDPAVCARDDSMCAAVLDESAPVVVPDAREDGRFASNPFVTGEIGEVRFYASAPLVTRSGVTIGRLCAFDDVPHEGLRTPEMLTVLAARVVDALELYRARAELARAKAELATVSGQLTHDLRNPLAALVANVELLETEPALADDPALGDLVKGARRSAERLSALVEDLDS